MRVIIDLRSLSGFPWSGVPTYTREIVRSLVRQFPRNEWIGHTSGRSAGSVVAEGIGEYWNQRRSNAWVTLFWNIPRSRWKGPRSDVYFLPNWNILPARMDIPLVLTIHDCAVWRLPWDGGVKQRLWHRAIQINRLLGQARRIICVSRSTAQELTTFFPMHENKIRVVPSAVPAATAHVCTSWCDQWKVAAQPLVALVGDSHQRKNIAACQEALRRISPTPLTVVVGVGQMHALNPSRWQALLAHARLLVYPSIYEGFGFPPQEAVAAGVPVAIAHAPALAETSGQQCWLMNPLDLNQMQRVIEEALASPRRPSPPTRSWDNVARETMAVLQEAVV